MKVSWLSINASYAHVSMAFPLLERQAAGLDIEWSLIEGTINERISNVVSRLMEHSPDVILGTAYLFTVEPLLKICERIKLLKPEIKIILGGPEFLGDNVDFLKKNRFLDAVVRGEGEGIVVPLLTHVYEPEKWSSIPGVCFSDGDHFYDDGCCGELLPMASIPNPMDSPFFDWSRAFVQIETSRGCLSKCSFCTSAISNRVRVLDIPEVERFLHQIRERGVKHVRVLDRSFNHPPERAVKLLKLFIFDFSEIEFHLEIYPNLLNQEMLDLIAQAQRGQLHLEVGIQSLDPSHLQAVKRPVFGRHSKRMLQQLCLLEQHPVHVDLLVGLPNQRIADLLSDLKALSEFTPEEIQLETLKVLKGTPLVDDLMRFGIVAPDSSPYEVLQTQTMSHDDIRRAMRISKVIDDYYNASELHAVSRFTWKEYPSFLEDLESFLSSVVDVETPLSLSRRYQLYHSFLQEYDLESAEMLEVEWIKNGHSPHKGLGDVQLWKEDIPDDCEFIGNVVEVDDEIERDARVFYIKQTSREVWLKIFRRSQKNLIILGEWIRLSLN